MVDPLILRSRHAKQALVGARGMAEQLFAATQEMTTAT